MYERGNNPSFDHNKVGRWTILDIEDFQVSTRTLNVFISSQTKNVLSIYYDIGLFLPGVQPSISLTL